MYVGRFIQSLVCIFCVFAISTVVIANGDCTEYAREGLTAYKNKNEPQLSQLLSKSEACSGEVYTYISTLMAQYLWNDLRAQLVDGAEMAQFVGDLVKITKYGNIWQAHATLGDVYVELKNFEEATIQYQSAIDIIQDTNKTPVKPDDKVITTLLEKGQQANLLSNSYVESTTTRDGEPGGLSSFNVRGIEVKTIMLPIEFRFGSTAFTSKGQFAIDDLANNLAKGKVDQVTLYGHTDDVGSDEVNNQLSIDRAERVAAYLRSKGINKEIMVYGYGETKEPVYRHSNLTLEEKRQIRRRVEISLD